MRQEIIDKLGLVPIDNKYGDMPINDVTVFKMANGTLVAHKDFTNNLQSDFVYFFRRETYGGKQYWGSCRADPDFLVKAPVEVINKFLENIDRAIQIELTP